MGRSANRSRVFRTAILFAPILGPKQLVERLVKESNKFFRTKKTVVIENTASRVVIRLIHNEGILMNDFGMDWHAGVFMAYAELTGARDIDIQWRKRDPAY